MNISYAKYNVANELPTNINQTYMFRPLHHDIYYVLFRIVI